MPYALCPMPYIPYICPMPYAPCPMAYGLIIMPYIHMPYALWLMPYALCPIPYALIRESPVPSQPAPLPAPLCTKSITHRRSLALSEPYLSLSPGPVVTALHPV